MPNIYCNSRKYSPTLTRILRHIWLIEKVEKIILELIYPIALLMNYSLFTTKHGLSNSSFHILQTASFSVNEFNDICFIVNRITGE